MAGIVSAVAIVRPEVAVTAVVPYVFLAKVLSLYSPGAVVLDQVVGVDDIVLAAGVVDGYAHGIVHDEVLPDDVRLGVEGNSYPGIGIVVARVVFGKIAVRVVHQEPTCGIGPQAVVFHVVGIRSNVQYEAVVGGGVDRVVLHRIVRSKPDVHSLKVAGDRIVVHHVVRTVFHKQETHTLGVGGNDVPADPVSEAPMVELAPETPVARNVAARDHVVIGIRSMKTGPYYLTLCPVFGQNASLDSVVVGCMESYPRLAVGLNVAVENGTLMSLTEEYADLVGMTCIVVQMKPGRKGYIDPTL